MTRSCDLSGKIVRSGNNVSHSHRVTKRTFAVNLQPTTFRSEILKRTLKLCVATSTIRTVDKKGGFDNYITQTPLSRLAKKGQRLKLDMHKALRVKDVKEENSMLSGGAS